MNGTAKIALVCIGTIMVVILFQAAFLPNEVTVKTVEEFDSVETVLQTVDANFIKMVYSTSGQDLVAEEVNGEKFDFKLTSEVFENLKEMFRQNERSLGKWEFSSKPLRGDGGVKDLIWTGRQVW